MSRGGTAGRRAWPGRVRDFLTSRPSWVWWVLAAAGYVLVWWRLPPALYERVTAEDVRVKAITDTRTALLAGLLGIGALATFLLNSRVHKLTEQGQITERYTKAIEQLGSTGLDVRLGGIYALERIAVDSTRDHPTIAEVLSAFVREHSNPLYLYKQAGMPGWQGSPDEAVLHRFADEYVAGLNRPSVDLQAAVTVLGRLPAREGVARAQLMGANLSGAVLGGANLSGADLGGANLSGADLGWANLSGAVLSGANLSDGARLISANLSGAFLDGANLSDVRLIRANLSDARLDGADLSGAHFGDARHLSQSQLDSARGDALTRLPEGLHRPSSWAP